MTPAVTDCPLSKATFLQEHVTQTPDRASVVSKRRIHRASGDGRAKPGEPSGEMRVRLCSWMLACLSVLVWGCGRTSPVVTSSTPDGQTTSAAATGRSESEREAEVAGEPTRSWRRTAKLKWESGSPTVFGECVGVSGDRLLVDATRIESNSRKCFLYVFERDRDGSWHEVARVPVGDRAERVNALAVDGDRAIVSVNGWDGPGGVYVFEPQPDGSWQQTAQLSEEDFVTSVALLEGRAIFGALGQYPSSVYIFDRQIDGSWRQVAQLTANDDAGSNNFGTSVSLMKDRMLVGAESTSEAGAVAFVFERQNDGSWLETATLVPQDRPVYGLHGVTVSLSDTRALVGTNWFRSNSSFTSGVAYLFEHQVDGAWHETAKLVPDRVTEGDFTINVSLSDDRAVVGAYRYTNYSEWSDAASIFDLQADGTWRQAARLTDDDVFERIGNDLVEKYVFADSVKIAGEQIVVGAPCDWEKNSSHPGAIYIFER